MPFSIRSYEIDGLFVIQPVVFGDDRGNFVETYSERDFAASGLDLHFVQDNQSRSRKGVLRGLHFQQAHPQGKLVRTISGEAFDVVVDLREGSPTKGKWAGIILSGDLHNQFYIPPGFAHGFMVLSDSVVFAYKCTDFFYPQDEGGLHWDDPLINIEWPAMDTALQLSAKDQDLPFYDPSRSYFKRDGSPFPASLP